MCEGEIFLLDSKCLAVWYSPLTYVRQREERNERLGVQALERISRYVTHDAPALVYTNYSDRRCGGLCKRRFRRIRGIKPWSSPLTTAPRVHFGIWSRANPRASSAPISPTEMWVSNRVEFYTTSRRFDHILRTARPWLGGRFTVHFPHLRRCAPPRRDPLHFRAGIDQLYLRLDNALFLFSVSGVQVCAELLSFSRVAKGHLIFHSSRTSWRER